MDKSEHKYLILYFACIIAAAFSLRSPITAVGPVVSQIKEDLNISSGIAGMLTTIPVLLFSLTAFFAGAALPRFRIGVSALVCLVLTSAGIVIRSYGGIFGLYAGTVLTGFGIGTLNVMIPSMNREKLPLKVGLVTGVYNVAMNLMAGMGSGLTYPLSQKFGGWRPAIAIWGIFPLLAIPLWGRLCSLPRFDDKAGESFSPFESAKKYLNRRVWAIAAVMALQGFVYYSVVIAWCPTMLTDKGISSELTGGLTIFMQMVSLIPAFLTPVMAVERRNRTAIALIGGLSYLTSSILYLTCSSLPMMIVCCILWGIGSGASFSYVLALITLSGRDKTETTWISGFVQMVGYAAAAIGPALFGFIVDASGEWTIPMMVIMAVNILYIAAGIYSGQSLEN